jgi:hypothetical protein
MPSSSNEYEPMKTTSHFVDHVVKSASYRSDQAGDYSALGKA